MFSNLSKPEIVREFNLRRVQAHCLGCFRISSPRLFFFCRFGVLWRYRYQVWPQLEDAAVHTIKVPPPSIDFTQPSPQFGTPPTSIPVVDPPWMPHLRDKTEEAISEDKTRVSHYDLNHYFISIIILIFLISWSGYYYTILHNLFCKIKIKCSIHELIITLAISKRHQTGV